MSTTEMARRMGVTQPRVLAIERAEIEGTIQFDTLRRAAEALECDLVYFLVPRTTLAESVRAQARRKAAAMLGPVAHNMRIEDQAVDPSEQVEDLAGELIDRRGLWTDAPAT
jgi:predicted DNA-binding mobile mystery protein A